MTSTMTESEFRERITGGDAKAPYLDNAVAAARAAGLEFSPEPKLLPPTVRTGPCGPSGVWIGPNSGGPLLQGDHETAPFAEALAARYNAYPGLRDRARDLLEAAALAKGAEVSALTFELLRARNVTRCEEVFHAVDAWTPAEWAVALAGEVGEACNAVKKLRRLEDGTNTPKDPQTEEEAIRAIGEELADIIIYADLLAARLGLDLAREVIAKFNHVSVLRRSENFL